MLELMQITQTSETKLRSTWYRSVHFPFSIGTFESLRKIFRGCFCHKMSVNGCLLVFWASKHVGQATSFTWVIYGFMLCSFFSLFRAKQVKHFHNFPIYNFRFYSILSSYQKNQFVFVFYDNKRYKITHPKVLKTLETIFILLVKVAKKI